MRTQYSCRSERRVAAVRDLVSPAALNGIDLIEVEDGHTTLLVTFVHDLAVVPAAPLTRDNVEIRGGVRIRNPRVLQVASSGNVLEVTVTAPGDFSPYVLRLVRSAAGDAPPDGIDPLLSEVEFFFKAGCPTDADC